MSLWQSLSLWDWARRAYDAPGVQAACLSLQDEHGQSVCLLLWAGWAAAGGRWPDAAGLAEAAALARTWERDVIGPLRTARRGLKAAPAIGEAARQALRARVQADELAAERALLDTLEAVSGAGAAVPDGPAGALRAASAAWGHAAPQQALETLARAFPRG
ncbi:MAG: TIGR02444 family protein [Caulobacteraceae bacterium]|nr:TIGR02444 family protein [Caulobacteraceae bacterium]